MRYTDLAFLKELTFRSADVKHATRVVQEIKTLRSNVLQRDRERAERATLVQQEKLIRRPVRLVLGVVVGVCTGRDGSLLRV